MLSSCFSSSTWVWLLSLVSLFPTISLSPYLAFSLFTPSLSISLFLSLTLGTAPLPDHLGLSSMMCVCARVCVFVHTCTCRQACVWVRVWDQFLLKRAYMCMSVFVCLCFGGCVWTVCVCVRRRVFLRQVDSCYLVALQPSQQSQGERKLVDLTLYSPKKLLNMDVYVAWLLLWLQMCLSQY